MENNLEMQSETAQNGQKIEENKEMKKNKDMMENKENQEPNEQTNESSQIQAKKLEESLMVFVKNIPKNWNEVKLYDALKEHGEIEKITMPRHGRHNRGYAFVLVKSREIQEKLLKMTYVKVRGVYLFILKYTYKRNPVPVVRTGPVNNHSLAPVAGVAVERHHSIKIVERGNVITVFTTVSDSNNMLFQ